jgi:hypothetical protein
LEILKLHLVILGLATIYIGSDADPVDGKDDITPSAYEEANGSGSGSYVMSGTTSSDIGVNASGSNGYWY